MRVARRGGLLAAVIFTPLVGLTVALTPGELSPLPAFGTDGWMVDAVLIALFCAPGIALLGAGLAGSTLDSRSGAAITGVAMVVGVPVAAVVSAIIGAFIVVAAKFGVGDATDFIGALLRAGVTAALRITPLVVLGAICWVALVRRYGRANPASPG
jgi:hypothetical protein